MAIKKHIGLSRAFFVVSATATFFSQVYAQTFTETELEIKPVVISIDRFFGVGSTSNLTIIDRDEIKLSGVDSLPELLSAKAGIFTTFDFFGNGSDSAKVDLRGFGAVADENTLILVNGRRIKTNDLASVRWSTIPLGAIERVEIYRGSGGVLFGRGATAGVVNIVTSQMGGRDVAADLSASFGSFNTNGFDVTGGIESENTAVSIFAKSYASDNYRNNNEEERNNISLEFTRHHVGLTYNLMVGADRQDVRFPGDLLIQPSNGTDEVLSLGRTGTNSPNDFGRVRGSHSSFSVLNATDNTETVVDVGWRRTESDSFFEGAFGNHTYAERDTDVVQISPRIRLNTSFGAVSHSLTIGADYENWDMERKEALREENINQPHNTVLFDQENHGYYLLDSIDISDTLGLTLGWRSENQKQSGLDNFDSTAPGVAAKFASRFEPESQRVSTDAYEAAIEYTPNGPMTLGVSTSRATRLANVDEVGAVGESDALFNKELQFLRPQVTHTHQLSISYASSSYEGGLSVYQIDTRDEIRLDPRTAGVGNTNFPQTKRQGIEIKSVSNLSRGSIAVNYAYIRAKFSTGSSSNALGVFDITDKTIPLSPRHNFRLGGLYRFGSGVDLNVDFIYVSEQFMDNDEPNNLHTNIPDYAVTDLAISQELGAWYWQLGAKNVFDREYYTYAVASQFTATRFGLYPQPERTFFFKLGTSFGG